MSASLLSIPIEIRVQILRLVVADALIVLENPDWNPEVKSYCVNRVLWRTRWGILATNRQLRREVLPFYETKIALNFPYSPDHSYAKRLSPFLRSTVIKIMLCTQGWNRRLVWHGLFPKLTALMTGSKLQLKTLDDDRTDSHLAWNDSIDITWDISEVEGGINAVRAGRCDKQIVAAELESTANCLKYADIAYPGREFEIHRQSYVAIVSANNPGKFKTLATMMIIWDYDTKTVLEKHWINLADYCANESFECLTKGSCSMCDEGMSMVQGLLQHRMG